MFRSILLPKHCNYRFKLNFKLRFKSSALYITGDKAQENFAILTPHIDVVERFENRSILDENVKARGLKIDLDVIANRWGFYQSLVEKKCILSFTKGEIGKEIANLLKDERKNNEEIVKLKAHMSVIKDEYSTLKHFMYGVEESAALRALSLPNILHEKTPIEKELEIFKYLEKPNIETPSHIDIGKKNDWLEVHDNSFAFLTNEAALYELALVNYFHEHLSREMVQFSNADFAKSVIVEGCGTDFTDKREVITLEDGSDHAINRLHLTGGASHYGFMAYLTRLSVPSVQFPLSFFAIGRKYQAQCEEANVNLFNLLQQSAVEIFHAVKSDEEQNAAFETISNLIKGIYKGLGCHFKLSLTPANRLENYETLRMEIQMFSNHFNDYMEVGRVSLVDDYLSKRLLFTYSENKERKFPKVLIGNVLNVQKVLACHIENLYATGNTTKLLNDALSKYVP